MTTDVSDDDAHQPKQWQRRESTGQKPQDQFEQGILRISGRLPSRINKLYRTPPTPDIPDQLKREKSFILDSVAVSSISDDFTRSNPKYGSVLPPYNGQKDWHTKRYYRFSGVRDTLEKNKQTDPGTSIEGAKQDWFYSTGHSFRYLTSRNERQANGYSNEVRMGHTFLWEHPNPRALQYERKPLEFQGFNGRFGYRRTTPSLRQQPSTFGVNTLSSIY